MKSTEFDPVDPQFVADPFARYRSLRDADSAAWSSRLDGWMITRYRDVHSVLNDHRLFSADDRNAKSPRWRRAAVPARTLINSDPPSHTLLRRVAANAFASLPTAEQEDEIRGIARNLIEQRRDSGEFDIIAELAAPLPLAVVGDVLGFAPKHLPQLRKWLELEIVSVTPGAQTERTAILDANSRALHEFVSSSIRDSAGGTSASGKLGRLRTAFVAAGLDAAELVSFVALLMRAATATGPHLIGNSALALLQNPEARDALARQPDVWPSAMEELIRYAGPVQSVFRIVMDPCRLHGVNLSRGDRVLAVIASANRDERQFRDPDRLDPVRRPSGQLGFGGGIHRCLGADLGKREARVALQTLFESLPGATLAVLPDELDYSWSWNVRGLAHLPVRTG